MGCYHPLLRIVDNRGRVNMFSAGIHEEPRWRPDGTLEPLRISDERIAEAKRRAGIAKQVDLIRCRQCIGCRLDKAREWATRIAEEVKYHPEEECWFLTLTYDEEHLPTTWVNKKTGVLYDNSETLNFEDLQNFWKRLRRHYDYHNISDKPIRYYAVGEYGEKLQRPHYHAIIFGCPITDIEPAEKSKKGSLQYKSAKIEKLWGNGRVRIGKVTWDSAAYVARYCMKKTYSKKEEWWREPEDSRESLKPGIGEKYYQEHKDQIYETDEIILEGEKPKKLKPPSYYDRLYDIDEPKKMAAIKAERKAAAEEAQRIKNAATTLLEPEQREIAEREKAAKIKKLHRALDKEL